MDGLEGTRGKQGGSNGQPVKKEGKQKYQVIRFQVKKALEKVSVKTNSKQEHDRITGIFINVVQQEALVGAEIDVNIDDTEILPEGFEATLINRAGGVSINDMPYEFDVRAQNSKVNINYKDAGAPNATYPYSVTVYLRAIDYLFFLDFFI